MRLAPALLCALVAVALAGSWAAQATSYVGAGDGAPAWSPDGTQIAFHSSLRAGTNDRPALYIARADGSGVRQLVEGDASSPAWSPDGERIAFASTQAGRIPCGGGVCGPVVCCRSPTGIVVTNRDGTATRAVVSLPGYNAGPSWSPDGRRIVFSNSAERSVIYLVDSDGGAAVRLTRDDGSEMHPSWSPDGRLIAFSRGTGGSSAFIFTMKPDGSERRRVTDKSGYEPAWSPDGSKIAFAAEDGIYVVRADGSGLTKLTGDGSGPAWSPDGRQIAFSSMAGSENVSPRTFRLFVVSADGSGRRALTNPRPIHSSIETPGVPQAGRLFTATLFVTPSHAVAATEVRCFARVGGRALRTVAKTGGDGAVSCRWRIPAGTSGKRVSGWVAVTGVVSHAFARRVR